MGVYENRIQDKMRQLGWPISYTAAVTERFKISGASDAALHRALKNIRELDSITAATLDTLLGKFIRLAQQLEPFEVRFTGDPQKAKELLEAYEAGELIVSVQRTNPSESIHNAWLIENATHRNEMFEGIRDGEVRWGRPGTPIKDQATADAAVKLLNEMGQPCHRFITAVRTTESKIAKSVMDLGFVLEERNAQ